MHLKKILIISTVLLGIGIFYGPLYRLALISLRNPMYSHALLIPWVSLYIFWADRKSIFSKTAYSLYSGAGLMAISLLLVLYQKYQLGSLSQIDTLSLLISCLVIWIIGGFLLVCGRQSFKRALFPLLFLGFMIPLPSFVLDPVVRILQLGSAWSAKTVLSLLRVPAYADGVLISLPGVTVEVAKACSGVGSALALFILSAVACYMYLKTNGRRIVFLLSVIPITIFKNGMRIATLAILGTYVDIHYLTNSALHSYGGKPFFLVAILMMAPIFWMLKKSEIRARKKAGIEKNKQPLDDDLGISKDIQPI